MLAFDPERTVGEHECAACGSCRIVQGQVRSSGRPHAVYLAACHEDAGVREVLLDVILGWATDDQDRVTFGCRVGPGADGPAATLADAAAGYDDDPEWGRRLDQEEALDDPRLPDFWAVVDYVLVHDPTVRPHVYGIA
ncbi:MAG TPA: hypothetical protein VHV74_14050 [Pseudonocardiaceae bacterium]|jgi:hypothetical protein|nr:hypothetical protein [Pseudonocardiaceae bacterium]